jgi:hypothetical protein
MIPSEFQESLKEVGGARRIPFREVWPSGIQKARNLKGLNRLSKLDEGLAQ